MDESMEDFFVSRKIEIPIKSKPIPQYTNNDLKNLNNTLLDISNLLESNNKLLTQLKTQVTKSTDNRSNKTIWYDVSSSITTATTTAPADYGSASYTSLKIWDELRENSPRIAIYNDGPGTLYTIISHEINQYTNEFPIYEGEAKVYNDIREIKMRSPVAGCKYRVTEYELWKQKNVDYKAGFQYMVNGTILIGAGNVNPAVAYLTATTVNFNAALTENATTGYIKNRDPLNTLYLWRSQDGTNFSPLGLGIATEYGTIDPNGAVNIDYYNIHSVKISSDTAIANVDYEIWVG